MYTTLRDPPGPRFFCYHSGVHRNGLEGALVDMGFLNLAGSVLFW